MQKALGTRALTFCGLLGLTKGGALHFPSGILWHPEIEDEPASRAAPACHSIRVAAKGAAFVSQLGPQPHGGGNGHSPRFAGKHVLQSSDHRESRDCVR